MARARRQRQRRMPAGGAASPPTAAAADARGASGTRPAEAGAPRPRAASASPASKLFGWWTRPRLAALGLAVVVALCYAPVFNADYIWDDKIFLEDAAPLQAAGGLPDIWLNPRSIKKEAHYWPLVYSSFWLEHRLWGFRPLGSHLVNLLLHGLVCLLLWRLLLRLGVPGAGLAAALFALHPVHVEAVAWSIARKDLLASVFYLLAIAAWLRHRQAAAPYPALIAPGNVSANGGSRAVRGSVKAAGGGGRAGLAMGSAYLAMVGFFVAGMLSKSLVITLPAALLVLAWWQAGRLTKADWLQTAPLFILGAAIALADLSFYHARAIIDFDHAWLERPIIAAKAFWFYLGKFLWPYPLAPIYPKWDINPMNALNWLPPVAALLALPALWLARQRLGRAPLAAFLLYAIILAPTLGLFINVFMEFAFAADRYQYLASAPLTALAAAALATTYHRLASHFVAAPPTGDAAGAAPQHPKGSGNSRYSLHNSPRRGGVRQRIALAGGGATPAARTTVAAPRPLQRENHSPASRQATGTGGGRQMLAFGDGGARPAARTLLATARALALALLATYGTLTHRHAQAFQNDVAFWQLVTAQNPAAHGGYYNLGLALVAAGQVQAGIDAYRKEISRLGGQGDAGTYINLSFALLQQGEHAEAAQVAQQAVAADPKALLAHQNLASALHQLQRYEETLAALKAVASLMKTPTAEHSYHLGHIANLLGRTDEAEAYLLQALDLAPGYPDAHRELLAAYLEAGRYAKARRLQPDLEQMLSRRGIAHFEAQRYEAALDDFRHLATLAPDSADAQANHGSALAQTGRLQEAIASFQQALALDPEHPTAQVNLEQALARLAASASPSPDAAPPPSTALPLPNSPSAGGVVGPR